MRKMLVWKPVQLDGNTIETSLTPDETAVLQELATDKHVMEIGSGFGYSAICMAKTAKRVTAIDPHAGELRNSLPIMLENLILHECGDKVEILREYSQDALPRLGHQGRHFEFAFIDGNHDDQVRNDVHLTRQLLVPGSFFAVHDYYEEDFPEIANVLDELGEPVKVVDTLWIGQV